jgi:colanic acid biosynthesis glycosyl transferase WcaI
MRILVVTDTYFPDKRAISKMIYHLSKGLANDNTIVMVLTKKEGKIFSRAEVENLEVNLWTISVGWPNLLKSPFFIRGIEEVLIALKMWIAIRFCVKEKFDYIISYTPPIFQALLANKLKIYYQSKIILNVQDIFPDNAIDLEIIKNSLIKYFYLYIEKKVYEGANIITSHTQGSVKYLIKNKNVSPKKIYLVENSISINSYYHVNKNHINRETYGLANDAIVFLFGGVIGPAQNLEKLLEVAQYIKNKKIIFLIIGDGRERIKLQILINLKGINNLILSSPINSQDYQSLAMDVDFGFCMLSPKNKTPVIPGKIYEFMALKLPVFGVLHKESDAHQLIYDAKCGFTMNADGDAESIAIRIDEIVASNLNLRKMGENGFEYVSKNNNIRDTVQFYKKLINKLEANI